MYEKLREVRKSKGYLAEDLARVIDNSLPNYSKKENGLVRFSVNEALKIADFLDCKVEDIFLQNDLQ